MTKHFLITVALFLLIQNIAQTQTFEIYSELTQTDNKVVAAIKTKNFKEIMGWQFTINWDTTELAFLGIMDYNLAYLDSSSFNTNISETGKIPVLWMDLRPTGVVLPDETTLFTITFETTTDNPKNLFFNSTPTKAEAFGEVDEQTVRVPIIFNSSTSPVDTGAITEFPINISTATNSSRYFEINWEPVNHAVGYKIQVREKGTTDWLNERYFKDHNLHIYTPIGKNYEYRLQTIFETYTSGFSPIYDLQISESAGRKIGLGRQ